MQVGGGGRERAGARADPRRHAAHAAVQVHAALGTRRRRRAARAAATCARAARDPRAARAARQARAGQLTRERRYRADTTADRLLPTTTAAVPTIMTQRAHLVQLVTQIYLFGKQSFGRLLE